MTRRLPLLALLLAAGCAAPVARESINPVDWGLAFEMDQGQVVTGVTRVLHTSGQVDLVEDASSPLGLSAGHPGDVRAQLAAALANVDAVLREAGMDRGDVLTVRVFTTDMEGFLANYDVYAEWIGPAGTRPPQTLLGVAALALPELRVEVEVTAGR